MGESVSQELVSLGATVVTTFRNQKEFDELKSELGENFSGIEVDVTDERAVREAVQKIIAEHGRVDGLVNLVGGYKGSSFLEVSVEDFQKMFALNTLSMFVVSKEVVRHMKKTGYGRIVTVGTATLFEKNTSLLGIYLATKAAVLELTKSLQAEFIDSDINVNAILPETMDTSANRKAMPKADPAKWSQPAEIAKTVAFLLSEESRSVRGAFLPVRGKEI